MIDHKKHRRLQAALEQAHMSQRAMAAECRTRVDEHATLRADLVRNMRQQSTDWDSQRDPVSALLKFRPEDLTHMRVDLTTARAAVYAHERAVEMQTRIAAASGRVNALATLVDRLNAHVAQGSN